MDCSPDGISTPLVIFHILSLYFLEREALHPFFKILCFPPLSPPSVADPGEEGRALSLPLFPSSSLLSSRLLLFPSASLGS
jgi:hypothetical protein